jgi:hypothetical protein
MGNEEVYGCAQPPVSICNNHIDAVCVNTHDMVKLSLSIFVVAVLLLTLTMLLMRIISCIIR